MTFRQNVYDAFEKSLSDKINHLQLQLNELKESAANETKSTAGDKYETARAMLQIEQDNIRRQLQELLEQQAQLQVLIRKLPTKEITSGSLIKTDKGWLLLGVALGKITIDNNTITALSAISPLGKQLNGRNIGDRVSINQTTYTIEDII